MPSARVVAVPTVAPPDVALTVAPLIALPPGVPVTVPVIAPEDGSTVAPVLTFATVPSTVTAAVVASR